MSFKLPDPHCKCGRLARIGSSRCVKCAGGESAKDYCGCCSSFPGEQKTAEGRGLVRGSRLCRKCLEHPVRQVYKPITGFFKGLVMAFSKEH